MLENMVLTSYSNKSYSEGGGGGGNLHMLGYGNVPLFWVLFGGLLPDFWVPFWAIPGFLDIILWLFPDFWVSFFGKIRFL